MDGKFHLMSLQKERVIFLSGAYLAPIDLVLKSLKPNPVKSDTDKQGHNVEAFIMCI